MGFPKTDVDIYEEVCRLALLGHGGAAILRDLKGSERFVERTLPNIRTIYRIVQKVAPPDPSGEWSFADADPEEARLVLDVVVVIVDMTEGRVWPTREVCSWIYRIRLAAPDIPAWTAYVIARSYQARSAANRSTKLLDLFLGTRLWANLDQGAVSDWVEFYGELVAHYVADMESEFAELTSWAEGLKGESPIAPQDVRPAAESADD